MIHWMIIENSEDLERSPTMCIVREDFRRSTAYLFSVVDDIAHSIVGVEHRSIVESQLNLFTVQMRTLIIVVIAVVQRRLNGNEETIFILNQSLHDRDKDHYTDVFYQSFN
jgi:hypothetical protein